MKRLFIAVLITAVCVLTACNSTPKTGVVEYNESSNAKSTDGTMSGQEGVVDNESSQNILQVALGSKDHTTLVAAVQAANQTTALANNGPLTVFAPTNAAFDALPEGTVETLLKPENQMKLTEIIQFHAAPGSYDINQLSDGQSLFVASGHNIKVTKNEDGVFVQGAKIIGTVKASNGIVHVVDKVLLPQEK
ncbi:MAG: fasciclin domain-containing protein [Flavobacteriales bacterium]|nr:fasciclin domain-containing protein [Bacteroidota bacterium]MCB9241307.1 fasciclin domain-containing protein [Flavobacteriales bacterium]